MPPRYSGLKKVLAHTTVKPPRAGADPYALSMTLVKLVVIVLSVVAGGMPLWGLISLYVGARKQLWEISGGHPDSPPSQWPIAAFVNAGLGALVAAPKHALRDVIFIGSGLLCGVAASVVSLWA
jgi:hypothetical protein